MRLRFKWFYGGKGSQMDFHYDHIPRVDDRMVLRVSCEDSLTIVKGTVDRVEWYLDEPGSSGCDPGIVAYLKNNPTMEVMQA